MRGRVWLVRQERVETSRVPRGVIAGREVHGTAHQTAHRNWREGS